MLTIKQITEDTEKVIKGLQKKHFDNAKETIEKVLEKNDVRRKRCAQKNADRTGQQPGRGKQTLKEYWYADEGRQERRSRSCQNTCS